MSLTFFRHFQQRTTTSDYTENVAQNYAGLIEHLLPRPSGLTTLNEINAVVDRHHSKTASAASFRSSTENQRKTRQQQYSDGGSRRNRMENVGGAVRDASLNLYTLSTLVNPSAFGAFSFARQLTLKFAELLKYYGQDISDRFTNTHDMAFWSSTAGSEPIDSQLLDEASILDQDAAVANVGVNSNPSARQTYKLVGVGLHCLRAVLGEISEKDPACCTSALNCLFHMLSGLQPESLSSEPREFVVSLYQLLIDLRTSPCEEIAVTASGCLLALAIAYGTPEMLMETISVYLSTILRPALELEKRLFGEQIMLNLPENFCAFFRHSLRQVAGWSPEADWSNCSPSDTNVLCSLTLASSSASTPDLSESCDEQMPSKWASLASDGRFVYVLNSDGLYKVGSGFGETKLGLVHVQNSQWKATSDSWLVCCNNVVYLHRQHWTKVLVLDSETLMDVGEILLTPQVAQGTLCCDGSSFYLLNVHESSRSLMLTPLSDSFALLDDDRWRVSLTETKLLLLGDHHSSVNAADLTSRFESYGDGDVVTVKLVKDAAFLLEKSGRVMCGTVAANDSENLRWNELPIPEPVAEILPSADGASVLFLCTNGQAYVSGNSSFKQQRVEEQMAKASGQFRARYGLQRPRRLTAPNNRRIVAGACSGGTVILLTENGRSYVASFGRSAPYSSPDSGQMLGLEQTHVVQAAMGKSHGVLLTRHGHLYTFGANHLGQCGRAELCVARADSDSDRSKTDDDSAGTPQLAFADRWSLAAGNAAAAAPIRLCAPSDHVWLREAATICTACGLCSARGFSCAGSKDKSKGAACGCGVGLSGCVKCGICNACGKQYRRASGSERDSEGDGSQPYPQLMPARLTLRPVGDYRAAEVACGLNHSVIRTTDGHVVTFGSNRHGQLGVGDVKNRIGPQFVLLPTSISAVQVAAGANHTLVRASNGQVYSWGKYHNGQLGRDGRASSLWYAAPGLVEGFGADSRKASTYVYASGDTSLIRYEQILFTGASLNSACVTANQSAFAIFPKNVKRERGSYFLLSRNGSTPKIYKRKVNNGTDGGGLVRGPVAKHLALSNASWCLDPYYNVFWSYSADAGRLRCHIPVSKIDFDRPLAYLQNPEYWIPGKQHSVAESQVGLSFLSSYYALAACRYGQEMHDGISSNEETGDDSNGFQAKEVLLEVNRFQSFGGGWGYSLQSVEAIQFSANRDIWLGGYGLFGGRGEYLARIKLLRTSNGEEQRTLETVVESDEMLYECLPKDTCRLYFAKSVLCKKGQWYVAWASISGPSSDCGAGGMTSVLTEDGVSFCFRNSRLSNNGTDVHVGQISSLLYSLAQPTSENPVISNISAPTSVSTIFVDKALTARFFFALTPRYLMTLTDLLTVASEIVFSTSTTACTTPAIVKSNEEERPNRTGYSWAFVDKKLRDWECERAASISVCCLRLLAMAVNMLYPKSRLSLNAMTTVGERQEFVPLVVSCGDLILNLLNKPSDHAGSLDDARGQIRATLLTECRAFLLNSFHLFFPTSASICVYLQSLMRRPSQSAWMMDAFLTALSRLETPVTCLFSSECPDALLLNYPLLTAHVQTSRNIKNKASLNFVSFTHFLVELLFDTKWSSPTIAVGPAAGDLLVRICADVVTLTGENGESCDGANLPTLFQTPKRFSRLSSTTSWDTGGGAPDAIAFQVDRSGVSIHGAGVYTGFGNFTYILELLVNQGDQVSEKWLTLEKTSGNLDARDCSSEVAFVKFHKPVKIEPNLTYALRLRMNGSRTWNGECGSAYVVGCRGVRITFFPCGQSVNGTNVNRGQLPSLLYSVTTNTHASGGCVTPANATKWLLTVTKSTVVRLEATFQTLNSAGTSADTEDDEYRTHRTLLKRLKRFLPRFFAYLWLFVEKNPTVTFDMVSSFDELLMTVVSVNSRRRHAMPNTQSSTNERTTTTIVEQNLEARQPVSYDRVERMAVESEHPYKPCKVYNYIARFDLDIAYMSLEFDSNCCTSQPEDSLQLYLASSEGEFFPVARMSGSRHWPKRIPLLPGNCVWFVLETASNYTKTESASMYGFKCLVTGYAICDDDALMVLEAELVNFCSYCCRQLIEKNYRFSRTTTRPSDIQALEDDTDEIVKDHLHLLRKGLQLEHTPNVHELISGRLPVKKSSPELKFLRDFIQASGNTAGGKLARWLMPEPYVDVYYCELLLDLETLRSGQTATITIITKDQYGRIVYSSAANVEVFVSSLSHQQRLSNDQEHGSVDNNNASAPPAEGQLEIAYQPTYLNKARYVSITMIKQLQKYSFEELRLLHFRDSFFKECVSVVSTRDGTYTAAWIPKQSGYYKVECRIDGQTISQIQNVEVQNGQIVSRKQSKRATCLSRARMATAVKEDTQGVRIRVAPSLQASQIGLLPPGATIFFVDECENSDGVWLKLNEESAATFCTKSSDPSHAWCMQYHAHLRKLSLMRDMYANNAGDVTSGAPNGGQLPALARSVIVACDEEYIVRKLEASCRGAPIRVQPQRTAKVLEMLSLNDVIQSTGWVQNIDGEIWVQTQLLRQDGSNLEGYCLVQEANGQTYLESFSSPKSSRFGISAQQNHAQALDSNAVNGNADEALAINAVLPLFDQQQQHASAVPATSAVVEEVSVRMWSAAEKKNGVGDRNAFGNGRLSRSSRMKPIVKVAPQNAVNQQVMSAMSPSVADSIRSVFAAVMWHERIVRDAMACAAYLKFHPNLQRLQFRQDGPCPITDASQTSAPIGLQMLYVLWREIYTASQTVVEKHWILPSPPMAVKTPDQRAATVTAPSAQIDGNVHQQSQLQFCELCEGWFPQMVTLHMRAMHPGCGSHAGGQGYNSLGRYGGGWTGNCGDGGIGSSPWYLLCHRCRANYVQTTEAQRQRQRRDRARLFRISAGNLDPQQILKNNALFLLELNMEDEDESFAGGRDETNEDRKKQRPSFSVPKGRNDWVVNLFPRQTPTSDISSEGSVIGASVSNVREHAHVSVNGDATTTGMAFDGCAFSSDPGPKLSRAEDELSLPCSEPSGNQPLVDFGRRINASSIVFSASLSDSQYLASPSMALQNAVRLEAGTTTTSASVQVTLRRPVMAFVIQHHDLAHVRDAMRLAIIRTVLLEYCFQVFVWILRNSSSPTSVVDVLSHFVSAMNQLKQSSSQNEKTLPHPLKLTLLAGSVRANVVKQFHALLQTVAGVLRHHERVPFDALRCCLRSFMFSFASNDQQTLLKSRILSTLTSIMSDRRDDSTLISALGGNTGGNGGLPWSSMAELEELVDLTHMLTTDSGSRRDMLPSLIDGSTETFWESGDEEKGKTKTLSFRWNSDRNSLPVLLSVYIDNCQDVRQRCSQISFTAIVNGEPKRLKTQTLESQFVGWAKCYVATYGAVRVELKGPDGAVRLRQVFLSGVVRRDLAPQTPIKHSPSIIMQFDAVQTDAFDLFQLLASNAFGDANASASANAARENSSLQQQVLNILFSRNQMQALQSYVSSQMVNALEREILLLRDKLKRNYSYCCGLMVMLTRVCSSPTGRQSVSSKTNLLTALSELPLFSSAIVQCQALETLEKLVNVFDPRSSNAELILKNFFIFIAKSLTLHLHQRPSGESRAMTATMLSDDGRFVSWHIGRTTSPQMAQSAVKFLTDMASECFGLAWANVVKTAAANEVANLALSAPDARSFETGVEQASFWMAAGALCVLQHQDWLQRSPIWRSLLSKAAAEAALCKNHGDGHTMAVVYCEQCRDHLCASCSTVLHLHPMKKKHKVEQLITADTQMQVVVREACSRLQLSWLLLSIDRNTMNGMAEFRSAGAMNCSPKGDQSLSIRINRCRFCDAPATSDLHDTCSQQNCQKLLLTACRRVLPCGHVCGGVINETDCPPCLKCDPSLKQDGDDMCVICYETLASAPIVQLSCAHVLHYHCCKAVLVRRWPGPRMTFNFMCCPICKVAMDHPILQEFLEEPLKYREDVRKKSLIRLNYDGLHQSSQVAKPDSPYFGDPLAYAMDRYAYYLCYKCDKPYFGGEAQCQALNNTNDYKASELLCGACTNVSQAQVCTRHGAECLEYKCRYCCSIAVFFCFGTTHFCAACHDDFQRLIAIPKEQLPPCPVGARATAMEPGTECPLKIKHPPTGEEFALGCFLCRNISSF